MKMINTHAIRNKTAAKKIIAATAALLTAGTVFAQETASAANAPDSEEGLDAFATDDAASAEPAIAFNGRAVLDTRAYVDETDVDAFDDLADFHTTSTPSFTLGTEYNGSVVSVDSKLKFSESTIKSTPADVIDELTVRANMGNFLLEAGKMKIVWGKGDKLHVLDNFNADDYTDFIIPDYIDRRISTPMIHAAYGFDKGNIRIEGVYAPIMATDRFAMSGEWTPASYTTLASKVTGVEEANLSSAFTAYNKALITASNMAALYAADPATYAAQYAAAMQDLTAKATAYQTVLASVSSFSADDLYPDTTSLRYGQAGTRITGTLGSFDWGASYYYGHYKQPSVDWSNYIASAAANSGKSYALPVLAYDQKQVFGVEGATVLGPLNLRAEAAYTLTEDTDGTNPWIHNNSVAWLGGFDVDLPVHNMNVNIQETGTYVLNNDAISDGAYKVYDVDYNANDCYTNDKLVLALSDSFMHDKLKTEATVMWGIENGDVLVMPKVTYTVNGTLGLSASGLYIWCKDDNSEFSAWKDNSFVNLGVTCNF